MYSGREVGWEKEKVRELDWSLFPVPFFFTLFHAPAPPHPLPRWRILRKLAKNWYNIFLVFVIVYIPLQLVFRDGSSSKVIATFSFKTIQKAGTTLPLTVSTEIQTYSTYFQLKKIGSSTQNWSTNQQSTKFSSAFTEAVILTIVFHSGVAGIASSLPTGRKTRQMIIQMELLVWQRTKLVLDSGWLWIARKWCLSSANDEVCCAINDGSEN